MEKFGGYKTELKARIERRERLALKKLEGEEHLEIYGRVRKEIEMKNYFHGPMDYAKTLKLQFYRGPGPARKKR